ncbi:Clp protease N-terminal domain-containing protein [Limnochorda pilosa]|uniref:Clp protease n=1 Tax=Limnochorda pilosa TaxID=1555112 RepID=A0A0K2SHC2_LIMPI|nr:Clp protease N-terminal domain-containing protein [Limnochorda pilosa]BAS26521.1 Clp protease [Limnochorda pilosa]
MLQFTERSRTVVESAEAEARQAGAATVTVAYLARALLELQDGIAHLALVRLNADRGALRHAVAAASVAPSASGSSQAGGRKDRIAFAPKAKALLEAAAREAEVLGHRYLGTEHLLLALAASTDPAGEALRRAGVTREAALKAVREVLTSG